MPKPADLFGGCDLCGREDQPLRLVAHGQMGACVSYWDCEQARADGLVEASQERARKGHFRTAAHLLRQAALIRDAAQERPYYR